MAENESLDLGRARRWQRVGQALMDGQPLEVVVDLIEVCLCKTINNLSKPLFQNGPPQVPLAKFFRAWDMGADAMAATLRECGGHEFARLFQATANGVGTLQVAVENFLSATCERYLDQIAERVTPGNGLTISEVRRRADTAMAHLQPVIRHKAQQLSERPDARLRPSHRSAKTPGLDTRSILGESLIGRQP